MAMQMIYGETMQFKYPQGATPLDHDEVKGLMPSHIKTQDQLNHWEDQNIVVAKKWAYKQKDILSVSFIQKLHQKMFDQTWRWAGKFRLSEKNIGIHWSCIAIKLKELCDNVQYQIDHQVYSPDEIAMRFHHALVFIHPFSNGNGRHARLMSDLLITKLGGKPFSWGAHQKLSDITPIRKQYIQALQSADRGDVKPLLDFARS